MGQPRTPLQPEVDADTVRIDPLVNILPSVRWYAWLLAFASPVILFAAALPWNPPLSMLWHPFKLVVTAVACASLGVFALFSARRRALVRDAPRVAEPRTPAEIAMEVWAASVSDPASRVPFDAGKWIDRVGPDGPRVIALRCELSGLVVPPDLHEAADLGSARPTSRSERWYLIGMLCWGGIQFMRSLISPPHALWLRSVNSIAFAAWGILLLFVLSRLGLGLFSWSAAVMTPGRLEAAAWGREAVFTRDDSVLLLAARKGRPGEINAWFIRRDGRVRGIWFGPADEGKMHPALSELLVRWCCRSVNG